MYVKKHVTVSGVVDCSFQLFTQCATFNGLNSEFAMLQPRKCIKIPRFRILQAILGCAFSPFLWKKCLNMLSI